MSQYPPPSYNQLQNGSGFNAGYGYGGVPPPTMSYGAQPMSYGVSYGHRRNCRNKLLLQTQKYQMKRLQENYPVKYVLVHSAILIAFAIAVIGIQIAMIVYKTTSYYVGSGIWVGAYYLLLAGLALLIIKVRNFCLLTLTIILHMLGFMISFGGLFTVSILAYTSTSYESSSSSSSNYFVYSIYTTTKATTTVNKAMYNSGLHIPMLVIGPVAAVVCVVFSVSIHCILNGVCGKKGQQVSNYNNSNALYQPKHLSGGTIPMATIPGMNTNPIY